MKNVFKSKTLWFNLLIGVCPVVIDTLTQSQVINPDVQTFLLTLGNIALRMFTNKAVTI